MELDVCTEIPNAVVYLRKCIAMAKDTCNQTVATARITNITTIISRAEYSSVMILLNRFRLLVFCLGKLAFTFRFDRSYTQHE